MNLPSEIDKLMRDNGYEFVRCSKHKIWRKGRSQITTSVSPRSPKALVFIRDQIRKHDREAAADLARVV